MRSEPSSRRTVATQTCLPSSYRARRNSVPVQTLTSIALEYASIQSPKMSLVRYIGQLAGNCMKGRWFRCDFVVQRQRAIAIAPDVAHAPQPFHHQRIDAQHPKLSGG